MQEDDTMRKTRQSSEAGEKNWYIQLHFHMVKHARVFYLSAERTTK
jgi:hypothetical protein